MKHFGKFMLAEVASLEWLRLSSINSFLALYIFGATVVGILLAAGYLSAFPSVQCRLLPPMLVVDPKRFFGPPFEKQSAPAELVGLIEDKANQKADQMVLLPTGKLAFPNNESRPLGFMFFDVQTGLARNVGLTEEFAPQGDVPYVKRHIGLARVREDRPSQLTDEQLSSWLNFLGWSEIGRTLGKDIRPGGKAVSELEPIIDADGQGFEIWVRLWIASDVLSPILIENNTNLAASGVRVAISFSGRLQGVPPMLLWSMGRSPFQYDAKTNSLEIRRIAPMEQLVLLTVSKSAVFERDVTVSWDRFSEVDARAIVRWLLMLAVACGVVLVASVLPEYRKRAMQ